MKQLNALHTRDLIAILKSNGTLVLIDSHTNTIVLRNTVTSPLTKATHYIFNINDVRCYVTKVLNTRHATIKHTIATYCKTNTLVHVLRDIYGLSSTQYEILASLSET